MVLRRRALDTVREAPLPNPPSGWSTCFTALGDASAFDQVGARWAALWRAAGAPYYLSPAWARTCVGAAPPGSVTLAEITDADGTCRGLGLLGAVVEKRAGALSVRQLRLNEAGAAADATVPVEENVLLCRAADEPPVWAALLAGLRGGTAPAWDEFVATNAPARLEPLVNDARVHRRAAGTAWIVDLAALRRDGVDDLDSYVASLGKNTRAQLRRSIRLYEADGPLVYDVARTREEARAGFDALAALHEAKWRALARPGVLSSRHLYEFHTAYIDAAFAEGLVEVAAARAGGRLIGRLYNFVDENAARYYMGGFPPENDNRLKPGLTTQALAVAHHLTSGRAIYDFMVGDERYKASLGRRGGPIVSVAVQAPRVGLAVEAAARAAKRGMQRWTRGRQEERSCATSS
ncbi:MAG: GNAT family N-acetyltransferase [Pseudomonadota bacterium]